MEEPENADDFLLVFEQIGWDRLLFATEYPHWDFDDPKYAFKAPLRRTDASACCSTTTRRGCIGWTDGAA